MNNNTDENFRTSGKYLGKITSDFARVSEALKESSYQLRRANFAYPIFPMCQEGLPIGRILIKKEILNLRWNYYASFLDEFLQRGLILKEREELFKEMYKDPDEFCCLFVVDQGFTQFVHAPFPGVYSCDSDLFFEAPYDWPLRICILSN